jgi:hypothetical protein
MISTNSVRLHRVVALRARRPTARLFSLLSYSLQKRLDPSPSLSGESQALDKSTKCASPKGAVQRADTFLERGGLEDTLKLGLSGGRRGEGEIRGEMREERCAKRRGGKDRGEELRGQEVREGDV